MTKSCKAMFGRICVLRLFRENSQNIKNIINFFINMSVKHAIIYMYFVKKNMQ